LLTWCVDGLAYLKFPSTFPSHNEFGHETAGGVVPVIGGAVNAWQAKTVKLML